MTDVKQLITEHLDIWLTAETEKKSGRGRSSGSKDTIYGVQKLRELILDLAIQGKLVKQDSTNKPAKDILQKIGEQKANLIRDGVIKNSRALPPISDLEQPFKIPSNWIWSRLNWIVSILGDGIHGTPVYEENTGLYFVNGNNLNNGNIVIKHETKTVSQESFEKNKKNLNLRSILVSINGTIGNVAFYKNEPIILGKSACYFNLIEPNSMAFMKTVLNSPYFYKYAKAEATGSTIKNLSLASMNKFPVPIPPIEEQQRIITKVDELMQLCDQLEEQQNLSSDAHATLVDTLLKALTESSDAEEFQANWQRIVANFDLLFTTDYSIEQLKQSILQLAVMGKLVKQDPNDEPASELLKQIAEEKAKLIKEGKIKKSKPLLGIGEDEKPFELPNGWELSRWENITYKIGDIDHKMPKAEKDGYPFVSPRDFYGQFIDFDNAKKISKEDFDYLSKKISPSRGDLIYPRYGTIGENVLVNTEQKFVVSYSCAVVKTITKYIDPNFQFLYSMSNACKIQAIKATNKTTQPNVGIKSIQEYIFAVPPLNEQKRIVEKVNQLFSMIEQLQALQSKLQKTKLQLADALVANVVEGV